MIVRILNNKEDSDKFFDCRNTCVLKTGADSDGGEEFSLIIEFRSDSNIEVVLNSGDEIYYMNNTGKTVHVDRRIYNK